MYTIALNFMVSSFLFKEKLTCFDEMPLFSDRDIKKFLSFKLFKELTEEQMLERIHNRHRMRQLDINRYYS